MPRPATDMPMHHGNAPATGACLECDLLVGEPAALGPHPCSALCPRCGALLLRSGGKGLEKALALASAGLALLALAIAFPVVGLDIQGQRIDTSVLGAAVALWNNGMPALSALVVGTTTVMPLVEIAAVIWLTLPLMLGRRPPGFARILRALQAAHAWAMVEVFILGVLVALVKLAHVADVVFGPAMLGFAALMLVLTAVNSVIEPRSLWQAWEEARP